MSKKMVADGQRKPTQQVLEEDKQECQAREIEGDTANPQAREAKGDTAQPHEDPDDKNEDIAAQVELANSAAAHGFDTVEMVLQHPIVNECESERNLSTDSDSDSDCWDVEDEVPIDFDEKY